MNADFPNNNDAYIAAALAGLTGRIKSKRVVIPPHESSTTVKAVRIAFPDRADELIAQAYKLSESGQTFERAIRELYRREMAANDAGR